MSRTRPEATRGQKQRTKADDPKAENPLYGVAMLKVAMELKRQPGTSLDDVLGGVLEKMGISRPEFEQYLQKNVGLIRTISQRRRT